MQHAALAVMDCKLCFLCRHYSLPFCLQAEFKQDPALKVSEAVCPCLWSIHMFLPPSSLFCEHAHVQMCNQSTPSMQKKRSAHIHTHMHANIHTIKNTIIIRHDNEQILHLYPINCLLMIFAHKTTMHTYINTSTSTPLVSTSCGGGRPQKTDLRGAGGQPACVALSSVSSVLICHHRSRSARTFTDFKTTTPHPHQVQLAYSAMGPYDWRAKEQGGWAFNPTENV